MGKGSRLGLFVFANSKFTFSAVKLQCSTCTCPCKTSLILLSTQLVSLIRFWRGIQIFLWRRCRGLVGSCCCGYAVLRWECFYCARKTSWTSSGRVRRCKYVCGKGSSAQYACNAPAAGPARGSEASPFAPHRMLLGLQIHS